MEPLPPEVTYLPPDKELIQAVVRLVELTKGTEAESAGLVLVTHLAYPQVSVRRPTQATVID